MMECYGLGFSEMEWGTCRMLLLKDGEEGKPLNYEEIVKREIDKEKIKASRGKAKYNIRNSGGYRLKEPLQNHHSERMKSQRK